MTADPARPVVERVLRAGKFFVAPPARLRIEFAAAELIAWEIFRGHLVDAPYTRQSIIADTWSVYLDNANVSSGAALVSIHHQHDGHRFHVTRQILTYGFEAYESSPDVIESRPVQKWVRELVGTIEARELAADELERELACSVLLAVIGTSRLPITSIESTLPGFSLGQLGYAPQIDAADVAWTNAIDFFRATLHAPCSELEAAKALESALRSMPAEETPRLAAVVAESSAASAERVETFIARTFRTLFNHAALSPYTRFVDRLVAVLGELETSGRVLPGAIVDVHSFMLRDLCRHLTAFDLTLFHNFGANYPDALFLDALLTAYLELIERHPALFKNEEAASPETIRLTRMRRRALRQASLVRTAYEGHRVPDSPTSLGDSVRVLPPPFARVSQEQIVQPASRRRSLFEGDPLQRRLNDASRRVLDDSVVDLAHPEELRELGTATFLARPLGMLKSPGEIDRTPLVAYEAFSRSIAARKIRQLQAAGWIPLEQAHRLEASLGALVVAGIPASTVAATERPGVVSLADAHKAASDFVLLRTTHGSVSGLISRYDLELLEQQSPEVAGWLLGPEAKIAVPVEPASSGIARLQFCDTAGRLRLELGWPGEHCKTTEYRLRLGVELVDRLQVLRVGEALRSGELTERDLRPMSVWIELQPAGHG